MRRANRAASSRRDLALGCDRPCRTGRAAGKAIAAEGARIGVQEEEEEEGIGIGEGRGKGGCCCWWWCGGGGVLRP